MVKTPRVPPKLPFQWGEGTTQAWDILGMQLPTAAAPVLCSPPRKPVSSRLAGKVQIKLSFLTSVCWWGRSKFGHK